MTVTPSILIASNGLLAGQSLMINPVMNSLRAKVQANVLIVNLKSNLANHSENSVYIDKLPDCIKLADSTAEEIKNRAQKILPTPDSVFNDQNQLNPEGEKIFISLFNAALSYCSITASFFSGIEQYAQKNFSDFGIKSKNYKSLSSNNLSNLFPNLKTKTELTSAAQRFAEDLANFGTLYDFQEPSTFGPKNLTQSLYNQGLTQKTGINNAIIKEGYDPTKITEIPDKILKNILAEVTGTDLNQVLKLTGANAIKPIQNLAELLDVQNLAQPQTLSALNISASDPQSIKQIGNLITNLGTTIDKNTFVNLLLSTEFQDYAHLDTLGSPLPLDQINSLKNLGSGSGLYGNPTLTDLLGTAAGETHVASLKRINDTLTYLLTKSYTTDLVNSLINNTDVQNTIDSFNAAIIADPIVANLVNQANAAIQASKNQLEKELNNLKKIGITITASQSASASTVPILNFASSLHNYGLDSNFLNTSRLIDACTRNNVYGNAVKNSLIEGRNFSRSQYVGKPISVIANQQLTDKNQAAKIIPSLEADLVITANINKDNSVESQFLLDQAKSRLSAAKRIANNNPLV